jgi:hypothetical protein
MSKLVNYADVLSDLMSRRDQLDHAIEAIRAILGESTSNGKHDGTLIPSSALGVYANMTIGDAAVHFLRTKGKKQSTGAIVKGLLAGGLRSQSKKPYTTVYNTLTARAEREDSEIVKVGSEWDLRERAA